MATGKQWLSPGSSPALLRAPFYPVCTPCCLNGCRLKNGVDFVSIYIFIQTQNERLKNYDPFQFFNVFLSTRVILMFKLVQVQVLTRVHMADRKYSYRSLTMSNWLGTQTFLYNTYREEFFNINHAKRILDTACKKKRINVDKYISYIATNLRRNK